MFWKASQKPGPVDLTFSQREGYTSLPEPLQLEELSQPLRIALWDDLSKFIGQFASGSTARGGIHIAEPLTGCLKTVIAALRSRPIDSISLSSELYSEPRDLVLKGDFNVVFDFIERFLKEIVHRIHRGHIPIDFYGDMDTCDSYQLVIRLQETMDRHAAAYHLTSDDWPTPPYRFEPHTSQRAAELTRVARLSIEGTGLQGVEQHLNQAAQYISGSQWPDATREGIHAVESVVREITGEASLSAGLKILASRGMQIHPALQAAFTKLYGYASDESGIRHALDAKQEAASVGRAEALFMYTACTAFVDYLLQKGKEHHRKD